MRILVNIYILFPTLTFLVALYRRRKFSVAVQMLILLLYCDVITEWLGLYAARQFKNNHLIYSFGSFVGLVFPALYFNFSIPVFRKYQVGILIAVIATFLGLIDTFFIEPQNSLKLNFEMLCSILLIIMSLYSIYDITVKRGKDYWNNIDFWLSSVLLSYRLSDFLYWGFFNIIYGQGRATIPVIIDIIHVLLNIFYYTAFCILFLRFPRPLKHED